MILQNYESGLKLYIIPENVSNFTKLLILQIYCNIYTDSTCRYKFDYIHLTIVDMTLIFLLDDTTSERKWLRYTRYVILYLKSWDPYFITSLQFIVHKLYFLPFGSPGLTPSFQ